MNLTYLITSVALALFFYRSLGRYDGPALVQRRLNGLSYGPGRGVAEDFSSSMNLSIRRQLSGSWFRASWMLFLWFATPAFLLSSPSVPDLAAVALALPGGYALAVAGYNIRKKLLER